MAVSWQFPESKDTGALQGAVEGYLGRSAEIFDASFLQIAEEEIEKLRTMKGFSFPTNEGMRKITKNPEVAKIEQDPVLAAIQHNVRRTISGVASPKEGGLYSGVNAFHHGHLAYLSKSEGVLAVDMNKLVPYGFAFIVGFVGSLETPEDFRSQVSAMAADSNKLREFFLNTPLEETALLAQDSEPAALARQRLLQGIVSTMDEFNPFVHGQKNVPPVFCWEPNAYDYFRTLIVQDKVAGATARLESTGFMDILARATQALNISGDEINTLYVSSCFDPRFAKPKGREKFLQNLRKSGYEDIQIVESFLNGGWIVYETGMLDGAS